MADRKSFPDSVIALPSDPGSGPHGLVVNAAEAVHRDEAMTLHFSLTISDALRKELEDLVAQGRTVPPDTLESRYAVERKSVDALTSWLKGEGYEVLHVTPDGTRIYARAKASQIEKSLGVHMVRVSRDGRTYTAACDAPSLPQAVAGPVEHIGGLQPFIQAHKHSRQCPNKGGNRTASPGAPAIANAPPYLVSEILKAYNADGLGLTGKGQEIAILIDTVPLDSDLALFWKANQINADASRILPINVNNATLPPPEGEESLDVEWSSSIAPEAQIRIYASGSLSFTDLGMAIDRIIADVKRRPGLRQVSISLGAGETYLNGPAGQVAAQHQQYLRLAAAGVNVFVSSGDAGSNPDQSGHASDGPLQTEYAASDPCVIGVGGTSLRLDPSGNVAQETGWAGSGGGKSEYFPRRAWQTGLGVINGRQRLVPDVSLSADPNEGGMLVVNGNQGQVGGTSWAAPVWAGFCALINESRVKSGKAPLAFLNPQIYPLNGTECFRDVTSGSNGAYQAGAGYDMVTGIGVPDVKALVAKLG